MPISFRFPLARTVAAAAVFLLGPGSLCAQPEPETGCGPALEVAEEQYAEQVYAAVEPLLLDCFSDMTATTPEVRQAYRLLALAYIKQNLIPEAHQAVSRLLYADSEYTADPLVDLPIYIEVVDQVREQLRPDLQPADPLPPADLPAAPAPPPAALADAPRQPDVLALVDLNAADLEALDALPGIGPALATRILTHRERHGAFGSVQGLDAVRGIGPRTLERLRPFVTVGGELAPGQPAGQTPADAGRRVAGPDRPPVNLNTATVEELETLPGIGPALAGRIVAFRSVNGLFRDLRDVLQVRGIGTGKLEGIAGLVTLR